MPRQGCHSQGKGQGKKISRSWKSQGILLQVSENEFFEKVREYQSWSGKFLKKLSLILILKTFILKLGDQDEIIQ